ncbi:unnamed protein product [Adineta steineri]|uniref:Uncharacterized protein n=2 Tax=Adineta steineri TaxID=433720 RepID=A0A819YNF1_9BILA|nr:unnamed protein product [Adineta steineri]CAF4157479.1 unnamed protein product [Adineta steineri]
MSSSNNESIRRIVDALKEERKIQEIILANDFLLKVVYTKDKKFVMPFSRRSIDMPLQPFIDQHDPSLVIRCGLVDLRWDYSPIRANKKSLSAQPRWG